MEKKGSSCKVPSLGSLQAAFLSSIATLFNAHGRLVARRPIETILACVLLTLVSTVGFFNFNAQTDRVKLWIPAGSVTRENSFWLNSNYPPDVRYQSAIVKGTNVLTPEGVATVWNISQRLKSVRTPAGDDWESQCKHITIYQPSIVLSFVDSLFGTTECQENLIKICLELNMINQLLFPGRIVSDQDVTDLNSTEILRLVNLAHESDLANGTN
jgi:hypothetical protein